MSQAVSNRVGGYRRSVLQIEDLYSLRQHPRSINPHEFGSVSWFKYQDSIIHRMAKELIIIRQRLMLLEAGYQLGPGIPAGKAKVNTPPDYRNGDAG